MQEDKPSVNHPLRARHGGHRERIFTEPVMGVLLELLGLHYYRIRDHLEKPQAVVTEIADTMNKKIPGLQLQPMQVYGRMINLQNSLRRYWESLAVGDYKKKPRYYDILCKVFGTDYNSTGIQSEEFINGGDDLDSNSPNHITVELPEFFDANTLGSGQYTTSTTTPSTTTGATYRTASSSGRDDIWTPQLTKALLQAMEECIEMLRSRTNKYKAWKMILSAVNSHCESNPMTLYHVKVKVKRMLAAVRKYDQQADRGQLFVDKPYYYDIIKTLFRKELRPYQRSSHTTSAAVDGAADSLAQRRAPSALTLSMQAYMRRSSTLLEESVQLQRDMRDDLRHYHASVLEQLRVFNDTYRMVATNSVLGVQSGGVKRRRHDDDGEDEYEEVEELMGTEQSDLEEGVVEQDDFDEMHVSAADML